MKTIRITGVPEHFNFPWKNVIQNQPFLEQDIELEWIDESRGSGQMNLSLRDGSTDLALVLTESFLKDFEAGNPSKMIGFHVISPLIWGIHVGSQSDWDSLEQIDHPHFYISRPGSGSNLMALVLAEKVGWAADSLSFESINNLPGVLQAYQKNPNGMFLWEKFTTKPWVDSNELKRIGEVPSPWPCFAIIATDQALEEFGEILYKLRDLVYEEAHALEQDKEQSIRSITTSYELKEEDVEKWFGQTKWATSQLVNLAELKDSMQTMKHLGILKEIQKEEDFLRIHWV